MLGVGLFYLCVRASPSIENLALAVGVECPAGIYHRLATLKKRKKGGRGGSSILPHLTPVNYFPIADTSK